MLTFSNREYEHDRQGLRRSVDEAQQELQQVMNTLGQLNQERMNSRRQYETFARSIRHLESRLNDVQESLHVCYVLRTFKHILTLVYRRRNRQMSLL